MIIMYGVKYPTAIGVADPSRVIQEDDAGISAPRPLQFFELEFPILCEIRVKRPQTHEGERDREEARATTEVQDDWVSLWLVQ